MGHVIGCDLHKKFSMFAVLSDEGELTHQRVDHDDREELRSYLRQFEAGTPLAFETTASWYWFVDEVEQAGLEPKLTNAYKAKVMMGNVNKHDKLDAEGLACLLRNGTLPSVWIPPAELRDQRELLRWRGALVSNRVAIKNRIHAILTKYGITIDTASDIFSKTGERELVRKSKALPPLTRICIDEELSLLKELGCYQSRVEERLDEILEVSPEMKLLQSAPGIGKILAAVILFEIGEIDRFPSAPNLASYTGLVPRINASGGKIRHGPIRRDVNHSLKYAFVEAGNSIVRWRSRYPDRHTTRLYNRIRKKRGHQKAVVAVGRHLAEATWWMLTKNEKYKEPSPTRTVHARQSAKGV